MAQMFGLDLGTLNMKIYSSHADQVYHIKNAIAVIDKNRLYAYGDEAYEMYEKAPERITVSFPVVNGVIAEYNHMQTIVFEYLNYISKNTIRGASYYIAVPSDITEVEKKAFYDIFYKSRSKPRHVMLCDKPVADALGMGVDVSRPNGVMVVDVGANTTEISVISLGGLVLSSLLHYGSSRLDDSITAFLRRSENLVIGGKTSMKLKETIGCALPDETEAFASVIGRNVISGLPVTADVSSEVVYEAIRENLEAVCTAIRLVLEKTPPELAKDILSEGIWLTGGGSKLARLDELISKNTGIKVNQAKNPDETAVMGLAVMAGDTRYKQFCYQMNTK